MGKERLQWIKLYPVDWRKSVRVRMLPDSAKALYIDLLCELALNKSDPGFLPNDPKILARVTERDIRKFKHNWKIISQFFETSMRDRREIDETSERDRGEIDERSERSRDEVEMIFNRTLLEKIYGDKVKSIINQRNGRLGGRPRKESENPVCFDSLSEKKAIEREREDFSKEKSSKRKRENKAPTLGGCFLVDSLPSLFESYRKRRHPKDPPSPPLHPDLIGDLMREDLEPPLRKVLRWLKSSDDEDAKFWRQNIRTIEDLFKRKDGKGPCRWQRMIDQVPDSVIESNYEIDPTDGEEIFYLDSMIDGIFTIMDPDRHGAKAYLDQRDGKNERISTETYFKILEENEDGSAT